MTSDSTNGGNAEKPNWWLRALRSGVGQAIRWLLVLALVVGHWLVTALGPVTGHGHWLTTGSLVFGQKGNPGSFAGWLPVIIISLVLLLPDVEGIAFGGVKLEMRRTREEVAQLSQQFRLAQGQAQATNIHNHFFLGGSPIEMLGEQLAEAAQTPDADPATLRALWDQD